MFYCNEFEYIYIYITNMVTVAPIICKFVSLLHHICNLQKHALYIYIYSIYIYIKIGGFKHGYRGTHNL
jgi:type III secretory pathway component EscS